MLGGNPIELGKVLPDSFQRFWDGQVLPSSPFRRMIPHGVVSA
jgi:hypothetical protein